MQNNLSIFNFKAVRDFIFQIALSAILFLILTSGGFLISRETYNFLLAHKDLHQFLLYKLIAAGALISWLRYSADPKTFFLLEPFRFFRWILNLPSQLSVTFLFAVYFLSMLMTLNFMHIGMETSLWDFGFNDSIIWNTGHGHFLTIAMRGGYNALGEHFTPIFLVLAPLYWISHSPAFLFLVQTFLIAGCIPLTYLITKKITAKHEWAILLAIGVFFYHPLRSGILFPFQAQTLADPFLLLGFYLILLGRDKVSLIPLLLALMCKENIVMEVLGIGLFSIYKNKKIGWGIIALAAFIFLLNTKIIEPHYQFDYRWNKWGYYSHITHPTVEGWRLYLKNLFSFQTISFAILVFGPFLFLPFRARGSAWLLAPTLAVRFLTSFIGFRIITAHYTSGLNALLFIGSAYGLAELEQRKPGEISNYLLKLLGFNHSKTLLKITFILATLFFTGIPHFFRMENDLWEASFPDNQRVARVLESIPPQYSIMSSETLFAHLTHRAYSFSFDTLPTGAPLTEVANHPDLLFLDKIRIQDKERKRLQAFVNEGYQKLMNVDFMEIYGSPDQDFGKSAAQWNALITFKDTDYRKIARRWYKRILLFSVIFGLVILIQRLNTSEGEKAAA